MERPESDFQPTSIEREPDRSGAQDGVRFEYLVSLLDKLGVDRTTSGNWPVETAPGMVTWQHSGDKGRGPGFTRYVIDKKGLIRGMAADDIAGLEIASPQPIGEIERTGLIGGLEAMVRGAEAAVRDQRAPFLRYIDRIDELSGAKKFILTSTGKVIRVFNGEILVDPAEGDGPYRRYGINDHGTLVIAEGRSALEVDTAELRQADECERQTFYGGLDAIDERARQVAMFE